MKKSGAKILFVLVGGVAVYYYLRSRALSSPVGLAGSAFPADAGIQEANKLSFDKSLAELKLLDAATQGLEGANKRAEQQKAIDAADISAWETAYPGQPYPYA